jgi:hypothetical protein
LEGYFMSNVSISKSSSVTLSRSSSSSRRSSGAEPVDDKGETREAPSASANAATNEIAVLEKQAAERVIEDTIIEIPATPALAAPARPRQAIVSEWQRRPIDSTLYSVLKNGTAVGAFGTFIGSAVTGGLSIAPTTYILSGMSLAFAGGFFAVWRGTRPDVEPS